MIRQEERNLKEKKQKRTLCVWLCMMLLLIQILVPLDGVEVKAAIVQNETTATETVVPSITGEPTTTEEPMVTTEPIQTATNGSVVPTTEATVEPVSKDANLRIMFTTDLHGQLDTTDYEKGNSVSIGGLSRVATAIKEGKQEVGTRNAVVFDLGDVLYDYTTDYIYEQDEKAIQPIYQAMNAIGYDAITLGNHEFDYKIDYVQTQLKQSGLSKVTVLSNVWNTNTGKNLFNNTLMLERTLQAEDGTDFKVKIGVIGETIPVLSTKRTSYVGVLTTEHIVENAKKNAKQLKEQGADIVVVLAHSGVGEENPQPMAENVGYSLTKLNDVDVVLCGHKHYSFPSQSANSAAYNKLPGVDLQTGLVNGKNLVMLPPSGRALGVIDLKLQKDSTKVSITNRMSSIKRITSNIKEDELIANNYWGKWKNIMQTAYSTILAEIASNERWYNYFATLEDTGIIQLMNNIRMSYAMNYINTKLTKYSSLPIVAESTYLNYGEGNAEDYIDIKDDFLLSYLPYMRKYKSGLYLYKMKGSQLKEWLEWAASGYVTTSDDSQTTDSDLDEISDSNNTRFLMKEEWRKNLSSFFVFDGIEYTMNIDNEPRYDINGNKISESKRVENITINGSSISDDQEFIVVGVRIDATGSLAKEIASTKIYSCSTEKHREWLQDYIEKAAMNGVLKEKTDNNWNVVSTSSSDVLYKTGSGAKQIADQKEWIKGLKEEKNGYLYYEVDLQKLRNEDTKGPNIVTTALNDEVETNKDVKVKLHVSDRSGVKKIQYTYGKFAQNAIIWEKAETVSNNTINCSKNGVYSVLAEDYKGNKSVAYFRINNINKSVLEAPIVDSYSNRMTKISGKAEPKAKIFFELQSGKIYKTTVNAKGTFSYALPIQKADSVVYVYAVDSNGRASARTVVTVKRTGPNKLTVNQVNSNSTKITGDFHDKYVTLVAIVDDTYAYVAKNGGKQAYQKSELFDDRLVIKEVAVSISDKKFTMTLPKLLTGGTKIKFYSIDNVYRRSVTVGKAVVQQLPNVPKVSGGVIYNSKSNLEVLIDEKCKITVVVGDKKYTSKHSSYDSSDGKYHHNVTIPKTNSGVKVSIYATNRKGNGKSKIYIKKEYAPNTPRLWKIKANSKTIRGKVHLVKSAGGKATVSDTGTKVYVQIGKKRYKAKIHNNGTFRVKTKKLKKGTKLVYWAENKNGVGKKGTYIVKKKR